ncbi:tetratricopeptide repeat protein 19 homolog, mitochondrial-like [Planococcus citri]|uniref:tetratricopeptide repeat protein 19 homolog, mitochondrial-like n=1 Tax=Planococcus citri TaxID=170843 RepID=UPI0031F92BEA
MLKIFETCLKQSTRHNSSLRNCFITLKRTNNANVHRNFSTISKIPNHCVYEDVRSKFNSNGKTTGSARNKMLFAVSVAGLLKFLGLAEEEEESELMQILKRGELSYRRQEFDKSERIFHVALRLAQELQNENAITFIYDRLANVAFESNQFEKARKLFVDVLNRLFQKGMKEDDLTVIHISFKLAKIFEHSKDYFGAHSGYDFCFQKLEPKLNDQNEEYEDALALYKVLLNGYAYFNYNVGQLNKALELFKKAYDVNRQIYGEKHEDNVLMLNNLGTIYKHKGDMNTAISYFHEAEKLGKLLPEMENFSFIYLNLGYCYMETHVLNEALKYCQLAQRNAVHHDYQEGIKESEDCIAKVKHLTTKIQ